MVITVVIRSYKYFVLQPSFHLGWYSKIRVELSFVRIRLQMGEGFCLGCRRCKLYWGHRNKFLVLILSSFPPSWHVFSSSMFSVSPPVS